MDCKLIKKVNSFKGEDGKDKFFTNYYLTFDNGVVVPVVVKYYTTSSKKQEDIDAINKMNVRNATKFDTLATLIKDEGK